MTKLFISYGRDDQAFAQKLAAELEANGFDVWIDIAEIQAGVKWSTAIQEALDNCEMMLVIISPDSMASTNVEDEWQYFLDTQKPVIPIYWQPAKIHFQLHRLQYVEFLNVDFTTAMTKLYTELERRKQQFTASLNAPSTTATQALRFGQMPAPIQSQTGKLLGEPFEWCAIPSGEVTIEAGGSFDKPMPFLVEPFYLGKYPITNAQFQVFVDAPNGWRNPEWWNYSAGGNGWHADFPDPPAPAFDALPDHPRSNVCWYDAIAFCRWLSGTTGEPIMLPTEQQWQRAAEGDDHRKYPWGDTFDPALCNTSVGKDWKASSTTPVTQYPAGASVFDVLDLTGNVWEWCLNSWETGKTDLTELRVKRTLRGGAFYFIHYEYLRVGLRGFYDASMISNTRGFRIARSN